MYATSVSVQGFRGVSTRQTLKLAVPDGGLGSGLTILVGPNGGGKSTFIEALRALSSRRQVSFSDGKRNKLANDRVIISATLGSDVYELRTVEAGGSETEWQPHRPSRLVWYTLPSRRVFSPYFGAGENDREVYVGNQDLPNNRGEPTNEFSQRLFHALEHQKEFDEVMRRVVDPVPEWTIDRSDQGGFFVKVNADGQHHNSDGLGEGIVSLLFVVDALYESQPTELIAVDEPELSLHPAFQRRLASLLAEYARDRQIVYATHSPYFVEFEHIVGGAEIARIHKRYGSSTVSQVERSTIGEIRKLLSNSHNPHILGVSAREALFREDGVWLVEGQEDVVYYPAVLQSLVARTELVEADAVYLKERLFGWGVGGAGNMKTVAALLAELGFERVVGVLDANKKEELPELRAEFPSFLFDGIPADDVRTKKDEDGKTFVAGLLDPQKVLREEYVTAVSEMIHGVVDYLRDQPLAYQRDGCVED